MMDELNSVLKDFKSYHTSDAFNLKELAEKYKVISDTIYKKPRNEEIQTIIANGASVSAQITEARRLGIYYVELGDYTLNVNPSGVIPSGDLTKLRFYALIHLAVHLDYTDHMLEHDSYTKYTTSPLVAKIIFTDDNPLTEYKYLMAEGFQYQAKLHSPNDIQVFYLGAAALDFLSLQSPKHPLRKDHPDVVKVLGDFTMYCKSKFVGLGITLVAMAKNLGDNKLKLDLVKKSYLEQASARVKFNMKASGCKEQVRYAWINKLNESL